MEINTTWLALLLAAGAGMAMAVQGVLNSLLGKSIGVWETNLVVHSIAVVLLLFLVFVLGIGNGDWSQLGQAPWYSYLGGLLSIVIIVGVISSIPKAGAADATTAIITAQIITAVALDSLGWFGLKKVPLTWMSAVGVVLLAAGAWCILRR